MYLLDVPPIAYKDPWDSNFEEQMTDLSRPGYRIVYYCDEPNNSTFRYRVYNIMQALKLSKMPVSTAYFQYRDLELFESVLEIADILVINRSKYTHKLAQVIVQSRARGIPTLYDIDDYVFDITKVHLVTNTLAQVSNDSELWDFWFAYFGRIGAVLQLCDAAITTNQFLAQKIRDFTSKPVYIIPNYLNKEQIEVSQCIYKQKKDRNFARDGQFHIGYFSGTPSHNKDFDVALDALISILDDYPQVVLRLVGYMDVKSNLSSYNARVEFIPFTDFINLQRLIGETELNIVPLQDNDFTNCKSQLKYFEAGVVGSVTIASPILSYRNTIRHGENGYLAKSYEWYEQLSHVIENFDQQRPIIRNAYQHSLEHFAWYNQISKLRATLMIDDSQK